MSKPTTLHMSQPVLYFFLPSLDYFMFDGKVPNFAFYGSNNKILFLLLNFDMIPWISTLGGFCLFLIKWVGKILVAKCAISPL